MAKNEEKPSTNSTAIAVVKKLEQKNPANQALVEEWEIAEREKEDVIRSWVRRLAETKNKMQQVNEQYKRLMTGFLQEAYAVYLEIESSDYDDEFYANVRWQLKEAGIKIQTNEVDPEFGTGV